MNYKSLSLCDNFNTFSRLKLCIFDAFCFDKLCKLIFDEKNPLAFKKSDFFEQQFRTKIGCFFCQSHTEKIKNIFLWLLIKIFFLPNLLNKQLDR